MNIGVNTWGLSKAFKKDYNGTLDELKELGITEIEPCFVLNDSFNFFKRIGFYIGLALNGTNGSNWFTHQINEKMKAIKEKGFIVKYAHLTFIMPDKKALGKMIPTAIELAKKYDIKGYVISLLVKDKETTLQYFDDIDKFSKALKEVGCKTIYHNHSEEMDVALDFLMENFSDLDLEFDVGWSIIGKKDPIEFLNKYPDRIKIIHFKDAKQDSDKDLSIVIGNGALDLRSVVEITKDKYLKGEIEYIIDQDASKNDIINDIRLGLENIQKYL